MFSILIGLKFCFLVKSLKENCVLCGSTVYMYTANVAETPPPSPIALGTKGMSSHQIVFLNPKILDWSKLKQIADEISNCI